MNIFHWVNVGAAFFRENNGTGEEAAKATVHWEEGVPSLPAWLLGAEGMSWAWRYPYGDVFVGYISLNGDTSNTQYNSHVILHEYGHWVMYCVGKTPVFGNHDFDDPINGSLIYGASDLAFTEGWAYYFSCAVRESSMYGVFDIRNFAHVHSSNVRSQYPENTRMQGLVASAFYNLHDTFSFADVLAVFRQQDVKTINVFYVSFVSKYAGDAAAREAVWEIFDGCYVAYDITPPEVSIAMTVGGPDAGYGVVNVLQATIQEDVAVKKIEWYINDTTLTPQSGDKFLDYGLPADTKVTVRVYDPAGWVAVGNPDRLPAGRAAFYGEDSFVIP